MPIFACRRCARSFTPEVGEIPLPPTQASRVPRGTPGFLPPRLPAGTYAVSAEMGGYVLNPADVSGARRHPDPGRLNGCCDLDGCDGPNLVCGGCGAEVAVLNADCWSEQQVTLLAEAVRDDGGAAYG